MKYILLLTILTISTLSFAQTRAEKQALKEMTDWLKSPMELNQKPKTISIRDSRTILWLSNQKEKFYLIDYTDSEGNEYVGFTGPITWSFYGVDYTNLSNEDIYNLYTGWCISFSANKMQDKNDPRFAQQRKAMMTKLENLGYQDIEIKSEIIIVDEVFFEIKGTKEGDKKWIVGRLSDPKEYDDDIILPFYRHMGEMWGPFN